jgi:hypothetical protein
VSSSEARPSRVALGVLALVLIAGGGLIVRWVLATPPIPPVGSQVDLFVRNVRACPSGRDDTVTRQPLRVWLSYEPSIGDGTSHWLVGLSTVTHDISGATSDTQVFDAQVLVRFHGDLAQPGRAGDVRPDMVQTSHDDQGRPVTDVLQDLTSPGGECGAIRSRWFATPNGPYGFHTSYQSTEFASPEIVYDATTAPPDSLGGGWKVPDSFAARIYMQSLPDDFSPIFITPGGQRENDSLPDEQRLSDSGDITYWGTVGGVLEPGDLGSPTSYLSPAQPLRVAAHFANAAHAHTAQGWLSLSGVLFGVGGSLAAMLIGQQFGRRVQLNPEPSSSASSRPPLSRAWIVVAIVAIAALRPRKARDRRRS